jgi:endonuclease IV
LATLINGINDARAGICFDTAHAFESGVLKYDELSIQTFFDEFDKKIGIEKLVVLHVNDSKTAFDSQHDRHENIGEGYIGLEGFKNLAKETRLHNVDWCLETPGFDGNGPDQKNIEILKNCFPST